MKKVLVVTSNDGVGLHRIMNPSIMLEKMGLDKKLGIEFLVIPTLKRSTLEDFIETTKEYEYDMVWFNRIIQLNIFDGKVKSIENEKFMQYFKNKGVKILMDLDDYWVLNKEHVAYELYNKVLAKEIIHCLKYADAVTVTTELLRDRVLQYNKNVFILPNTIAPGNLNAELLDSKTHEGIQFGWVGGVTHYHDLLQIKKGLPTDVHYVLGGFDKRSLHEWKRMESIFTRNYTIKGSEELLKWDGDKSIDGYTRVCTRDIWSYLSIYENIDVALIPLLTNEFNSYKSPLKLVEAAVTGTAIICDNVEPYKQYLKNKKNCLLVNNKSDWAKHINTLKNNPSLITDLLYGLRETVLENFNWMHVTVHRAGIFSSLLN